MSNQRIKSLHPDDPVSDLVAAMETVGAEKHPGGEEFPESGSREYRVPRHCTLDGFVEETSRCEGVHLTQLAPLSKLYVKTQNTLYQIILLDPGESKVLIQGGRFFPELTEAVLCGSSFGGSLLKSYWIGIGMRMEIFGGGRTIVTSSVHSYHTEVEDNLPGPF